MWLGGVRSSPGPLEALVSALAEAGAGGGSSVGVRAPGQPTRQSHDGNQCQLQAREIPGNGFSMP